jgi:hypothetical protein
VQNEETNTNRASSLALKHHCTGRWIAGGQWGGFCALIAKISHFDSMPLHAHCSEVPHRAKVGKLSTDHSQQPVRT